MDHYLRFRAQCADVIRTTPVITETAEEHAGEAIEEHTGAAGAEHAERGDTQ